MARNKKETVQFTKTITAGTNTTLSYVVKSPGTVQRIFGKFYAGQENQLQVRPYLELTGQRQEELITYPANSNRYLSGDDRPFDIAVDFDVTNGDQIKLYVANLAIYDYTLELSVEIDYVGGTSRVI